MARQIGDAAGDFAVRFGKLAAASKRGREDTLKQMGLAAKAAQNDQIRRDTGDMRLSGVGRRGARVGSRFDMRQGRVEVKATGPLHFVAHPMSPHRIPRERTRGRRRYAVIPGVGVRSSVQHPGTKGKDTWRKGTRRARRPISDAARDRMANAIRRGFS